MKNKVIGASLLIVGLIALTVIVLRVIFYKFEFDPKYYPVDYGRFNFFSYFTVQSNLYAAFYITCLGLAVFGFKRAEKIAFHPMVRLTVTTYILVTGAVYCAGIPMGMTPPLLWKDFSQQLLSFVQILHHMVIPILIFILFLMTPTDRKIKCKQLPLVGIYPLVYSLFSIARGAVSNPQFYPYPFYRPEFFWNLFFNGRTLEIIPAYLLMIPMLISGISVFVLIALFLKLINNKLYERNDKDYRV